MATVDEMDVNLIARRLVEAYFGLSPQGRLSSDQKRAYSKLFNASRQLLEYYMKQFGLYLHEAAGHLDKAKIEREAGLRYVSPPSPPEVAPEAAQEIAPVQVPEVAPDAPEVARVQAPEISHSSRA